MKIYFKLFILNSLIFKFIKKCLKFLNSFVSLEFDEDKLDFVNPVSKILYGQAFYSIIPKLSDLIVKESLYKNENFAKKTQKDYDYQNIVLSIVRFNLKTVSIKSLIKVGLKETNLEFLLLNFCQSRLLPKIIEAFSSNLKDSSLLFKSNNEKICENNAEKFYDENTVINLYTLTVNSNALLYKYHRNHVDSLNVMKKIHENLSIYVKNYIETTQDSDLKNTSRKLSYNIVKNFTKRLNKETNLKYRFYKHTLIVNYITVIGVIIV